MKHGRSWEGAAPESDAAWCRVRHPTQLPVRRCRVWVFFFFFFSRSHRLGFYSHQFVPNQDDSARIKLYQPNQVISAGNRNGSKQPKSALNHAETAKIGFEWDPNILNLSFLNFILNICCFFCVFFFVLCFVCVACLLLSLFCDQGIVMCFSRIF